MQVCDGCEGEYALISSFCMQVCDGCEGEYALCCLNLDAVPESDTWWCHRCTSSGAVALEPSGNCQCPDKSDTFLICDGCDDEHPLCCLGLDHAPDEDEWFCDKCTTVSATIE